MREERVVYDSGRLRVYERDQELFDGTSKVFVRAEKATSALILPMQGEKILLGYHYQPHREHGYWAHIGGVIERGEDPEMGAKRELFEETGRREEVMVKALDGEIDVYKHNFLAH